MTPEVQTDPLERAHEALREEQWDRAAELARLALRQAELMGQQNGAALARFILGTALSAPIDAADSLRMEAEIHLNAALPHFTDEQECELAGETRVLLGGLCVVRARSTGEGEHLDRAVEHYRGATEDFSRADDLVSKCTALHNLGLCLSARAVEESLAADQRALLLDDALQCFHDALELELECGLSGMVEATDRERQMAQRQRDAAKA